ncbi:MAG TPA: citrate lyase holo-[acyl-carrier protein] synthase [Candidatus Aphodomonas merdavium]|nr:citrate lyase holo-[acyl-carrier protein] synthase [Candidatus Aphodomonas merdavium]
MIVRWGDEVTLAQMLAAREARALAQRELRAKHCLPLISFTLNMPGPIKDGTLVRMAFDDGVEQIEAALASEGVRVHERRIRRETTGCDGFFCVEADAERVKALCCAIEEHSAIGRFFDIDVLDAAGEKLERERVGAPVRRCFLCGRPAAECARSRAHGVDALRAHVEESLNAYLDEKYAAQTMSLALRALLYEVAVTPKPGLVDRANAGAHRDMDFFSFMGSAAALAPYFRECTLCGLRCGELPAPERFLRVQHLGRGAERAMCEASGGANTHKGAIFSLGLLCAARGYLRQTQEAFDTEQMRREAAVMAEEACKRFAATHGGALFGARAEALSGFQTAEVALEALSRARAQGKDVNAAGVGALLRLLAAAEDTNLARRGGAQAPAQVRAEAARLLAQGGDEIAAAQALDEAFIARNLSPGGCADLLAVAFFLLFCQV